MAPRDFCALGCWVVRDGALYFFATSVPHAEVPEEKGFVRGTLTVAGLGADAGRTLVIDIQNEYLVATEGDKRIAMVPDLICIVDSETGRPIGTEEQRYGLRVAILSLPAPALLRTDVALALMGPRAFGYDFDFVPLGQSTEPAPVAAYLAGQAVHSNP